MKHHAAIAAMLALATGLAAQTATERIAISVNAKKAGAAIQPTMYGIFFEDINYAADGGLYAELIKNRSFEFTPDHLMGWHAFGRVEVRADGPFERNPHYVRLASMGHNDLWTGLQNEGFFGIGLHKDADYRLSLYARLADGSREQMLRVQFVDQNTQAEHQEFAQADIKVTTAEWQRYEVTLKSPRTIEKAQLRIFLCEKNGRSGRGTVDVEHVSLFPTDTWQGHRNGMRRDVAQALHDLHPGVFRFPGGCIVEGTTLDLRYQWKNTVGPVENRPINKNRWENTFTYRYFPDYFQSYGLGFFEYFQLAEEIGAEPLPVLNVGMACQYQNDDQAHAPATEQGLRQFIDDCIDLIDFANGDPATNEWARLRADMGHPEPFGLKYLAIGNEQWEKPYFDRLAIIAPAVRRAHPEIKLIGTSGPNAEDDHFRNGWAAMRELKADLVDEHYYRDIDWFRHSMNRYDNYDRRGPKVFAGEWACHDRGKKWNHAGASIYEAAFMTNLERNADVVHMATYAPLFSHIDGWQWRPDLIWYDNLHTARTASYYVQQLYMQHRGTHVLPTTVCLPGGQPAANPVAEGDDGVFASAVTDKTTGQIIIKVINTTARHQDISISLTGLKAKAMPTQAEVITLDCSDYDAENLPSRPERVAPRTTHMPWTAATVEATIPAKTFALYILS